MAAKQRDNSTFREKRLLRQQALREVDGPLYVLETHGGLGKLGGVLYEDAAGGVVFEKDPRRAQILAKKRPGWAVYEADCETALAAGAGAHLEVNFLDVDPYGSPWETLQAFFGSDRPRAERLEVVVQDGLRQKVRVGGAWSVHCLEAVVQRRGNDLNAVYLEVCKELMEEKAGLAGYRLVGWRAYHCGYLEQMTHYHASLLLASPGVS